MELNAELDPDQWQVNMLCLDFLKILQTKHFELLYRLTLGLREDQICVLSEHLF